MTEYHLVKRVQETAVKKDGDLRDGNTTVCAGSKYELLVYCKL